MPDDSYRDPSDRDKNRDQSGPATLTIAEERARISAVRQDAGGVRVRVVTEQDRSAQTIELASHSVDVTRHPMDREIDAIPEPREDGDLLIVPVVEERAVVVTRLFLVEEIHIRRSRQTRTAVVPVTLRRQHAVTERLDPLSPGDSESPAGSDKDPACNLTR